MLYDRSGSAFSDELFQNPGADYRGAPFWAWNTKMTPEMIEKQIPEFKKMGMGGFHIHVRTGLRNRYLSDEFMDLVRFANEQAKKNGMLCWLYDEDRYSSGIAGGIVTWRIRYRARSSARPGTIRCQIPWKFSGRSRTETKPPGDVSCGLTTSCWRTEC